MHVLVYINNLIHMDARWAQDHCDWLIGMSPENLDNCLSRFLYFIYMITNYYKSFIHENKPSIHLYKHLERGIIAIDW